MTPREIRFGIDGLTGLVVASVGAALASLTWTIAGYGGSSSPISSALGTYVAPMPAPDLAAVVNLPPFGRVTAAPAATAADQSLVLSGVLLAVPASASTVLISVSGQKPVSYRIGEVLPNGATIDTIGLDSVLLRSNNQYQTLYFPEDERAGRPTAPSSTSAPTQPLPTQAPATGQAGGGVEAIRALLPPSVTGRPLQPVPVPPPPPAPAPAENAGSSNGLIDSPGSTVTPR